MRLVEVVEVEDERALGRGEAPEVGEVGVAAELRVEADARRRGEVVGHDRRRAAVEGERRDEHSAVAHRHELGDARRRLRLEDRDGVAVRAASSKPAWLVRGHSTRAARPRAARSSGVKCSTFGAVFFGALAVAMALRTLRRWVWGCSRCRDFGARARR